MARARTVQFTEDSARRVAAAVREVERMGRGAPPIRFRQPGDDAGGVRLGKTVGAWDKGTLATIDLYETGDPPNETNSGSGATLADCVNKFADVAADSWVMVAQAPNGRWYLIAAECDPSPGSGS